MENAQKELAAVAVRTAHVSRAETYIIWKDVVTLVYVCIHRVSTATIATDAEARALQAARSIPRICGKRDRDLCENGFRQNDCLLIYTRKAKPNMYVTNSY